MSTETIMQIIACLLGVLLLLIGIKELMQYLKANKYTGKTEAEVIEIMETSSVSKGNKYYFYSPFYQYVVSGQTYTELFDIRVSSSETYHIGDKSQILYDESNPKNYMPDGSGSKVLKNAVFYLIGGIAFLGFGIYGLLHNFNIL